MIGNGERWGNDLSLKKPKLKRIEVLLTGQSLHKEPQQKSIKSDHNAFMVQFSFYVVFTYTNPFEQIVF